jgi:hypothetical protein
MCQRGWRESNFRFFYDESEVEGYWDPKRYGVGEAHERYTSDLKNFAVRKVLKDDSYGVIQRGGPLANGPTDIDRPWVTTFSPKEVIKGIKVWPPADLKRFFRLDASVTTCWRRAETGEEHLDVPASEILDLMGGHPERDVTMAMMEMVREGYFKAPKFMTEQSLTGLAGAQACPHEGQWQVIDAAFQMFERFAVTQTHFDYSGTGALICILTGRKLVALTAARKHQFMKYYKWTEFEEGHPALWWSEYAMDRDTPVFRIELLAGDVLWVPSGWAHFVISLEQSQQVGFNIVPVLMLPRSITHWRHEREMQHRRTPCVLPCGCQPKHGMCGYLTTVVQYLRSKPSLSPSASRMIQQFLVEEKGRSQFPGLCEECNKLDDVLTWLSTSRLMAGPINMKRAAKRLAKKQLRQ